MKLAKQNAEFLFSFHSLQKFSDEDELFLQFFFHLWLSLLSPAAKRFLDCFRELVNCSSLISRQAEQSYYWQEKISSKFNKLSPLFGRVLKSSQLVIKNSCLLGHYATFAARSHNQIPNAATGILN